MKELVSVIEAEAFPRCAEAQSDEEFLEALYDSHAEVLCRYALALIGSPADAEDAVQEVFVRLARGIRRVRRIREPRNYLLRATRNAAYSLLRSRQRAERLTEAIALEAPPVNPDACPATVGNLLLREAFGQLPAEQREVLALKVFEGMTFPEIARVTGVSSNTAASRYRYAVTRLRRILEESEDG